MFVIRCYSLSLGIETVGHVFTKLLKKYHYSNQKSQVFSTAQIINLLDDPRSTGEREMAQYNKTLVV